MVPGYVRRHPRIATARVERNEWDGSLTGIVDLIIPWPDALASSRQWRAGQWWRDWPAEPSFGTGREVYAEPSGEDLTKHPYLMASATLAFPLHPQALPAAPAGPGDDLEGKARRAVAALVTVPTVAADPPFNEHLMTDIGGLSLAMAVILGASALAMERNLTRAALAGYAVYAASHLAFHASHLDRIPPADAALLVSALAGLPALALALLLPASGGPTVSPPRRDAPDSTLASRGSRGRPR